MKRTWFEKIIVWLYYLLLVSGVIMFAIEITTGCDSYITIGVMVLFGLLCFKANDILERDRSIEYFERYTKANELMKNNNKSQ